MTRAVLLSLLGAAMVARPIYAAWKGRRILQGMSPPLTADWEDNEEPPSE
jgi:hypothetical protein